MHISIILWQSSGLQEGGKALAFVATGDPRRTPAKRRAVVVRLQQVTTIADRKHHPHHDAEEAAPRMNLYSSKLLQYCGLNTNARLLSAPSARSNRTVRPNSNVYFLLEMCYLCFLGGLSRCCAEYGVRTSECSWLLSRPVFELTSSV